MLKFCIKRSFHFVFLIWAASSITFCFIHLIPGDPVVHILGEGSNKEDIQRLRSELKLDESILNQYVDFQKSLLFLDFGKSIVNRKKVIDNILIYLPNTLFLSIFAMGIAVLLSFPMGILAAFKQNSFFDSLVTFISSTGIALPNFLLGPLLILLFSIRLGWFPVSGSEGVEYLILPSLTLGLSMTSFLTRIIKASIAMEINKSYVVLAKSKGFSDLKIFFKHILKNALTPIITTLGLQMGALLTGTIITETIFSWQGIGCLLIQSINRRDYPMIQGVVVFMTITYLFVHLLVDIIYLIINPRQLNEIKKK
ncbi:MAG: ABC transporter permease [Candidatus Aminicenantes bacterium]|nr:ABC transporter permease [Candidatus Aminicenantes bacterium]